MFVCAPFADASRGACSSCFSLVQFRAHEATMGWSIAPVVPLRHNTFYNRRSDTGEDDGSGSKEYLPDNVHGPLVPTPSQVQCNMVDPWPTATVRHAMGEMKASPALSPTRAQSFLPTSGIIGV